jgi:hypothetical protein
VIRSSVQRALLLTLALGWVGACEQDAYRVPNYGEAGLPGLEAGFPDAVPTGDLGLPDLGRDTGAPADLSADACLALSELCNNVDDNCNGQIDEGFDKLGDARYCDSCKGCKDLIANNAVPACNQGSCVVQSCQSGWIDLDADPKNGCEYQCTPTAAVEVCDGIDNDCNGKVDDLPQSCTVPSECIASFGASSDCVAGVCTRPTICKTLGPCAGATASCQGKQGWVCSYGAGVELQPCDKDLDCGSSFKCVNKVCPGVVIADESLCDGVDGDCDGSDDDPWRQPGTPNVLGKDCDPAKVCNTDPDCGGLGSVCVNKLCTPKKGICRDTGAYVCDPADPTRTVCKLVRAGLTPTVETCNGQDDDCNGTADDNLTDEVWVTLPFGTGTVTIFKYEASRPDATATAPGIQTNGRACSVSGRLPWASVTKLEAKLACEKAGGRLCSVDEWRAACRGVTDTLFPYGATFVPDTCNGGAYDTDPIAIGNQDSVLTTDNPTTCVSPWGTAGELLNMSGNVKEWTVTGWVGAPGSSAPLGYELRGGAYDTPNLGTFAGGLSCDYQLPDPEPATSGVLRLPTLGFRCCK